MEERGGPGERGISTSGPLATYSAALSHEQDAWQRLNRSITFIQQVATLLMKPDRVHIRNVGFPPPPRPHNAVDGNAWPSAGELAKTLAEWETARADARKAWTALTDEERRNAPTPRT